MHIVAINWYSSGYDRPTIISLNQHVIKDIASKWYEVGLQLQKDEIMLREIETIYSNDDTECCKAMLQLWLIRKGHNATWNQLIEDLKSINENVASKIESKLLPLEDTVTVKDAAGTGIKFMLIIIAFMLLAVITMIQCDGTS